MSTENQTPETVATKPSRIVENVMIKNITYVTTKEGQNLVILHTTPCKKLKDKDGNAVTRFKLNRKVFEQRAKEVNKPLIIFEKQCIGASYEYVAQPVKAGDAFLQGEGQYTKDHNAKVSDKITISSAVQAMDAKAALDAYYASQFSVANSITPASVEVSSKVEEGDGSDIDA